MSKPSKKISRTSFKYSGCLFVAFFLFIDVSYAQNKDDDAVAIKANAGTFHNDESIRIGLLLSEDPAKDPLSQEAVHAIYIAVNRVNETGGIHGRKIDIITRSCDGNWGAGSKQSVDLIYEEEVTAIIGSLDGRNAHLAEMVVTRAQIVYMDTRATDPTLSESNIPWFLRVVPSDKQQGKRLIEEIYEKRQLEQLAVVSSDTYDDEMAANTFIELVQTKNHSVPLSFKYDHRTADFREILEPLATSNSEGIVYFGRPDHLKYLIREMEKSNVDKPVFGPLSLLQVTDPETKGYLTNHIDFICFENRPTIDRIQFTDIFKNEFGYEPGVIAALSYDGINILMETIKHVGTDSQKMRKHLSRISYSKGITGKIKFSENGDRINNTVICN